jgi:hypothetical protein
MSSTDEIRDGLLFISDVRTHLLMKIYLRYVQPSFCIKISREG